MSLNADDAATQAAAAAAAKTTADAAAAAAAAGDKDKHVVPESYTFAKVKSTTKDAAGAEVVTEADAPKPIVDEVAAYAKANGYSAKQAQALLDRELKLINDADVADKKAQADGLAALKKQWTDQARADKELGGEGGAAFDANIAITKRALAKFFPEIEKDANKHPFLDHPQVLKGLLKIGQLVSPDGEFVAGKGSDTPRDAAKTLFPGMN